MLWYEHVYQGSGGDQPVPIKRQAKAREGLPYVCYIDPRAGDSYLIVLPLCAACDTAGLTPLAVKP